MFVLELLNGHISPETAFVQDDYPYGRTLRCKRRVWVETASKGAQKGNQRFMAQTTNPKASGEVWNKPHGSIYSDMVFMVRDTRTGYVHNLSFSAHNGEDIARLHGAGIYAQLGEAERKRVDGMVKVSDIINQRFCKPGELCCFKRHNVLMGRIRERLASGITLPELQEVAGILDLSNGQTCYPSDLEWAWVQVQAEDNGVYLAVPEFKSGD